MVHFANKNEVAQWNIHILSNPDGGNILQGYEFAEQKRSGGWTPRYILADNLAMMVLEKSILGLGKLWYMPKGPGITSIRELDELLPELEDFALKNNVFTLKIEPELVKSNETMADLMKLGFVKASPIQPNFSTVLLDISDDLDTIMMRLNQKGRHAIKRAERDGVTVKLVDTNEKNCQVMYDLLAKTAEGLFRIRNYGYYKKFWQRYTKANLGQLFFAYTDNQIVAGAFAIAFGEKGTYKDGASIRKRTVYGASHLLQWHVIKWMKQKGVKLHDLCGAPPSEQINNPDHTYYGIGRFKTSFNKEVTDYVGAYDIVVRPAQYRVWTRFGERIALRLYNMRYGENYY